MRASARSESHSDYGIMGEEKARADTGMFL